jgi:hypothetical protein
MSHGLILLQHLAKSGNGARHRSFQFTVTLFGQSPASSSSRSPGAQSGQTSDILFSCRLISATTDCVSSPAWILFAKNLIKSAVRRNSCSQFGVKLRLPLDSSACGRASTTGALSTRGALASIATGGGLSSIAAGFASSRRDICLMTSAPTTIRYSGTSTYKSLSCLMARTVTAPSPNLYTAHHTNHSYCAQSSLGIRL